MKKIGVLALIALLLGCSPAGMMSEHPVQVIGPENHALVLDGVA
ncbi:MAG TPA: hypothetical protein VL974_04835 [Magnetospirillum sp.]|jgi:hypothetical protein|nr:hypothetical protein [Magnetospirillum sp.]